MIKEGLNIRCKIKDGEATGTITKEMDDMYGIMWDSGKTHTSHSLYFWNKKQNIEI